MSPGQLPAYHGRHQEIFQGVAQCKPKNKVFLGIFQQKSIYEYDAIVFKFQKGVIRQLLHSPADANPDYGIYNVN